jgi:hypothetical protein
VQAFLSLSKLIARELMADAKKRGAIKLGSGEAGKPESSKLIGEREKQEARKPGGLHAFGGARGDQGWEAKMGS